MTIEITGTQEEVTAFLYSMGESCWVTLEEMQEQEEDHD